MALPPRSDVAAAETWDAASVFDSPQSWESEREALVKALARMAIFPGTLGQDAAQLAAWLELQDELGRRIEKLYFYAAMSQAVDTADQAAAAMVGQAASLYSNFLAAGSFAGPEILGLGEAAVQGMVAATPELQRYMPTGSTTSSARPRTCVRARWRRCWRWPANPSRRSSTPARCWPTPTCVSRRRRTARARPWKWRRARCRPSWAKATAAARRTAWESYADGHLSLKHTFASNFNAVVRRDVFNARARRYSSSLEAALFPNNIAPEVFHNLIDTFRRHIPTWHRYWAVRRRALGVATLQPYDIWAPIASEQPEVPFETAVDWICEGMAVLGADYVRELRRGCLEQRWVDRALNQGKTQGAFSFGAYDTHPFILMSYDDSLGALSTLAHELGHSMHSLLTRRHQPFLHSDYSMFVAEVASNLNQALVRDQLFRTQS